MITFDNLESDHLSSLKRTRGSAPFAIDRRRLIGWLGLLGCGTAAGLVPERGQAESASSIQALLETKLPKSHPRLHLDDTGWAELRRNIAADTLLSKWHGALLDTAHSFLGQPPVTYRLDGPRLLEQSRTALRRISTLAGLYRLHGDTRFSDRARLEMRAVCAFPNWNPPHILDAAEMSNAVGLGYDWLYEVLEEEERKTIREKIIAYGLLPGLAEWGTRPFWARPGANNIGQVLPGGFTVGALAIAQDDQEANPVTARALAAMIETIPFAMASYAPDGGWPEGPGYWSYATNYTCAMISALTSSLGTDFGLADMPGFNRTGDFRVGSIGPSGLFFNYADGSSRVARAPEMLWLARRFREPLYAMSEHEQVARLGPDIFHLIWSQPGESQVRAVAPSVDMAFTKIGVVYLRSAWKDPDAIFIGFKGGTNGSSHSHLDLGSFVLDALGERWALDLGPDDYNLPTYFGKARPSYYRIRTEGHNCLTFRTDNQNLTAHAPVSALSSSRKMGEATVDLTEAYQPILKGAHRQFQLQRDRTPSLRITDSLSGGAGHVLRWNFHTDAVVSLDGAVAILAKNGKRLRITIEAPTASEFKVIAAAAPQPQAQQPTVHTLIFDTALREGPTLLTVLFDPL